MWLLNAIMTGHGEVPAGPIALCRVVFSLACLLKFWVEARRNYETHMVPGSFVRAQYDARRTDGKKIATAWKIVWPARPMAALLLLCGIGEWVPAAALALFFFLECRIFFKFHACFFCLISASLAAGTAPWQALTIWTMIPSDLFPHSTPSFPARGDWISQALIMQSVTALYWCSALQKLRSHDFMSGRAIHAALLFTHAESARRRNFEAYLPRFTLRHLVVGDGNISAIQSRWASLSWIAVASEIFLPIGLWSNVFALQLTCMIYGLFMHLCFTFLAPATLFHFSIATVGCYLAFLNPYDALGMP